MIQRIWQRRPCDDAGAEALVRELRVSPVTAQLLSSRGVVDPDVARRFLSPSLDDLHDPFVLPDMEAAVSRIFQAIARHERIAMHGDYVVKALRDVIDLDDGISCHWYSPSRCCVLAQTLLVREGRPSL